MNAYWADKRAFLERVTFPAYVVASWTSAILPRGTLAAFRELASADKWLGVHNTQEWLDTADAENVRDLYRFLRPLPQGPGQRMGGHPPGALVKHRITLRAALATAVGLSAPVFTASSGHS